MKKLLFHIEASIWSNTPLAECQDVLSFAVGTYNSRAIKFLGVSDPESLTWDEWIRELINRNSQAFEAFDYGFSGDHFWLHNAKGERAIFIHPIETNQ